MSVSDQLFRKYNVPGPRYTSYPTVPYWVDSPTESQWLESVSEALAEGQKQGAGAALYIHIPFCRQACIYCNFYFKTGTRGMEEMVEGICREVS